MSIFAGNTVMKKLNILLVLCALVFTVSAQHMAYRQVQGTIPKFTPLNTNRIESLTTPAYINYMQSDSAYFPLAYFTNYMFYMNSRYDLSDTGANLANELLLQSFGVMFDTIIDVNLDTGYTPNIIQNITIDSLNIIVGQANTSHTPDTIIVQIDSVDATGYPTGTVLHSDTVFTGLVGLSSGNNWLNPYNLIIRPNYPFGYQVNYNKFAVTVFYYGAKNDTMGFLPGFPYVNCAAGGSGPIPEGTKIGNKFGTLRANSYTSGYKYFYGDSTRTIPTSAGATNGLYLQCTKPSSKYWYFQDNPIGAYVTFTNTTGVDELKANGFSVNQNYPNPFNKQTRINYNLTKEAAVNFTVCDLAGRQLVSNNVSSTGPGQHTITLDANTFTPGVYFYTFTVNGVNLTHKMVVTQ
jgi:hypothetical protein